MSFFSTLGRWLQRRGTQHIKHQPFTQKRTPLALECLETRSLLSATPFVNFSGFTPDTGILGDNLTRDAAITLSGTGTPDTPFILYANTTLITRSTVAADGTWSIKYPKALGNATYTFKVVPSTNNDPIASGVLAVTIDKLKPTVSVTPQKFVAGSMPQVLVKAVDARGTDAVVIDIDLNGNRKIEANEMGLVQSTIVSGVPTLISLTSFPNLPTVYLRARVTDLAGNETTTALVAMKGPQPNKVALTVPASTSAVVYNATVQVTSGLNNGFLPGVSVDVDLNKNGVFEANEEFATGTLNSFGRATLPLSGLVAGSYRVRARITDLYNREVVSATQVMSIKDAAPAGLSPVIFEPNAGQVAIPAGQTDPGVQFVARIKNGPAAFLSPTLLTMQAPVYDSQGEAGLAAQRMVLVGANASAQGVGQSLLASDSTYYVHSLALENLRNYGQVLFSDVYTNVDVRYRGDTGIFAYDFLVNPGGNPDDIVLDFPDAVSVSLDASGQLVLGLADGQTIVHGLPLTYQLAANGVQQAVASHFVLTNGQVSFQVGAYDLSRTLYIDPYVFTNFLVSDGSDNFEGMTQDTQGNLYIVGTSAGANYPEIPAPTVTNDQAATDVVVTKLDSSGKIIFSVYLGGDRADTGGGIAVDFAGNVYVTGQTASIFGAAGNIPFPISIGTPPPASILPEAFVTMLNPNGTINQSTLLGGNGTDNGTKIVLDGNENIYVAGSTSTFLGFPAPVTGVLAGFNNIFLTKFSRRDLITGYQFTTSVARATLNSMTIDSLDRIYMVGDVSVINNIGVTANAYVATSPSPNAGFVLRLLGDGTPASAPTLDYSTYLGGDITNILIPDTTATGIAVDTNFDIYVSGTTNTNNFFQPALTVGLQTRRLANQADNDAYVIKLHIDPTVTTATAGTYFGNRFRDDQGMSIALDSRKNIYLYGYVSKLAIDATAPAIYNKNPVQTYLAGNDDDAFVAILTPNAAQQLFGTTVGGSGAETLSPNGFIVDPAGTMYVAGATSNTTSFQTQVTGGKGTSVILGNSGTAAPIDIFFGRIGRTQTQNLFQDVFELNDTSDVAKGIDRYINAGPIVNLTTARHTSGLFDFDWFKLRAPSTGTLTVTLTNISVFAAGPKETFGVGGDLNLFIYRRVNGFLYLADKSIISKSGFQRVAINVNGGEDIVIQVNPVNFTQALYTMRVTLA